MNLKIFKAEIEDLIRTIDDDLKKELIDVFIEDNKHLAFLKQALEELR